MLKCSVPLTILQWIGTRKNRKTGVILRQNNIYLRWMKPVSLYIILTSTQYKCWSFGDKPQNALRYKYCLCWSIMLILFSKYQLSFVNIYISTVPHVEASFNSGWCHQCCASKHNIPYTVWIEAKRLHSVQVSSFAK